MALYATRPRDDVLVLTRLLDWIRIEAIGLNTRTKVAPPIKGSRTRTIVKLTESLQDAIHEIGEGLP